MTSMTVARMPSYYKAGKDAAQVTMPTTGSSGIPTFFVFVVQFQA